MALAVILLVFASGTAHAADGDPAAVAYQRALSRYAAGDIKGALTDMSDSLRLSGRWELLYNIARLQDELGRCADALASYREYLQRVPDGQYRAAAAQASGALEARCPPAQAQPEAALAATAVGTGTGADAAPPARRSRLRQRLQLPRSRRRRRSPCSLPPSLHSRRPLRTPRAAHSACWVGRRLRRRGSRASVSSIYRFRARSALGLRQERKARRKRRAPRRRKLARQATSRRTMGPSAGRNGRHAIGGWRGAFGSRRAEAGGACQGHGGRLAFTGRHLGAALE